MHFKSLLLSSALFLSYSNAQLHKYAVAAGLKYFGTAVDNPALGNAAYMAIARDPDEFGMITPANGQKWANTEGSRGGFSYGMGDAIAGIVGAERSMRCHTLVWHNQLPGWGELSGGEEALFFWLELRADDGGNVLQSVVSLVGLIWRRLFGAISPMS